MHPLRETPTNTKFFALSSTRVLRLSALLGIMLGVASAGELYAQQTPPPPNMGEDTKGTPAYDEERPLPADEATKTETTKTDREPSFFGTTKVTESRRENGQVYLIELEHSSGSKQYIEELDSDGNIESKNNDIEQTPNLPKWKIGSWD